MARIINTALLEQDTVLSHNDREWVYNGLDCCVTLEIRDVIKPMLTPITKATYEFSLALQAPILDMSMRGVLVDEVRRKKVLKLFNERIDLLSKQLTLLVNEGVGFTTPPDKLDPKTGKVKKWWRSVPSLKNLFYDVMGMPVVRKRNAQGRMAPTINREALEKLSVNFAAEPLCAHLLALRDLDKKRGFLETGIDPDGRMRCNFNIAGTNTGRLASSLSDYGTGTNLQNVDRDLRYTFVADPGYIFINLDLEQADARNIGALCWQLFVDSHGPAYAGAYLDACESGDLHTTVCSMGWRDLPWTGDLKLDRAIADQIAYRTYSYRDLAKKLGHGTNYYGTPPTMAKHTKVDKAAIELFQRAYFAAFPAIGDYAHRPETKNYHNWVKEQLKDYGKITSLYNRQRYFFGRWFEDTTLREAIAYGGQSPTADEIDTGILQLWRSNRVQLLVQVHDSILLQCPVEAVNEITPWALKTLRSPIMLKQGREFTVPTEAKVGFNWGDFNDDPKRGPINLDGLMKWKGVESRMRLEIPNQKQKLSLRSFL